MIKVKVDLRGIIRESIERYLDEVKIADLKNRYPRFGSFIDDASVIISNKYLEWLVRIAMTLDTESRPLPNLEAFSTVLKQFEDNVKRGKIRDSKFKDVSKWINDGISLQDVINANEQALEVKTSTEKEKEVKELGVKKWYDDENYLIVEPKTMEASCYYGSGTRWCISARVANQFKGYHTDEGFDFLFVINKKRDLEDPKYKLALLTKHHRIYEVFDAKDKSIYNVDKYKKDSDRDYKLREIFGLITDTIFEIVKKVEGISSKTVMQYLDSLEGAFYEEGKGWTIKGDVILKGREISKLPIFVEVGGNFDCSGNELTSLEGAPKSVGGGFYCYSNELTSLEGAPKSVGSDFNCSYNQLTSLKSVPKRIGGIFDCSNNELISLEGSPESVSGDFYCSHNELTSLEGAPKSVGGGFYCSNNELTSLEGAPKSVGGRFDCSNNKLTSLKSVPKRIGGNLNCLYNPLKDRKIPAGVKIAGKVYM